MQDRFKFRIWSNTQSKYLTDDDIWELTNGFVQDPYCLLAEIACPTNDNLEQAINKAQLVVEQCTGLKDKNGKLIYEGDIVKVSKFIYELDEITMAVSFYNGAFVADDRYIGTNAEHTQVIGNIHENSSLLIRER